MIGRRTHAVHSARTHISIELLCIGNEYITANKIICPDFLTVSSDIEKGCVKAYVIILSPTRFVMYHYICHTAYVRCVITYGFINHEINHMCVLI